MTGVDHPDQTLTGREREVLQQAALGLSNREIGIQLEIAEQTVKNHVSNAMRKLSLHDRTHAVVVAMGRGLISVPIHVDPEPGEVSSAHRTNERRSTDTPP